MPCHEKAVPCHTSHVPEVPRARSSTCHRVPEVSHATSCRFDRITKDKSVLCSTMPAVGCSLMDFVAGCINLMAMCQCVPAKMHTSLFTCHDVPSIVRAKFTACRAVPEVVRAEFLPVRAMPKIASVSLARAVPCQSIAVPQTFVPRHAIILPCLRVRAVPEPP